MDESRPTRNPTIDRTKNGDGYQTASQETRPVIMEINITS